MRTLFKSKFDAPSKNISEILTFPLDYLSTSVNFAASFNEIESISSTNNQYRLPSEWCSRARVVFTRNDRSHTYDGGQDLVEVFTETFDEPGLKRARVFLFPITQRQIS